MSRLINLLEFRLMVGPTLIKILWVAATATSMGGGVLYVLYLLFGGLLGDVSTWELFTELGMAFFWMVTVPFFLRIVCEIALLPYRIDDTSASGMGAGSYTALAAVAMAVLSVAGLFALSFFGSLLLS